MERRQVKATKKDYNKEILALCNSGQIWSPRLKKDAINDILNNGKEYFVNVRGREVKVIVRNGHLTTEPDYTEENNLKELPNC